METPTIIETGNGYNPMMNGFGGYGMGSGFIGGLILGSLWNGNGFGFGGNGRGQAVADVSLANAIEHVSDQVNQGTISQLQSSQNIQNAINAGTMAGMNANNASTMAINNAIQQGTVSQLQGDANLSQQMCCCCNNLGKQIDATGDGITAALTNSRIQDMQNTQSILGGMSNLGQAITSQGYQAQLTAKDQTILLGGQHSQIMAAIADTNARNEQQHCQDRELMRQIATENLQAKLTEAQARIVQLETQNYVNQSNSQQTLYLINQLAPATAAARTTATTTGA